MKEEVKQPTSLLECFRHLDDIFKESEDSDWFVSSSEDKAVAESHHGLGQWIRNNWIFGIEDSTLLQYFKKLGLSHADDISGLIITSYHRHLNKKELKLDEQINHYIDFWKNNSK